MPARVGLNGPCEGACPHIRRMLRTCRGTLAFYSGTYNMVNSSFLPRLCICCRYRQRIGNGYKARRYAVFEGFCFHCCRKESELLYICIYIYIYTFIFISNIIGNIGNKSLEALIYKGFRVADAKFYRQHIGNIGNIRMAALPRQLPESSRLFHSTSALPNRIAACQCYAIRRFSHASEYESLLCPSASTY